MTVDGVQCVAVLTALNLVVVRLDTGNVGKTVAEFAGEYAGMSARELGREIVRLEKSMHEHARNLEFEEAAAIRDRLVLIRQQNFELKSGALPRKMAG